MALVCPVLKEHNCAFFTEMAQRIMVSAGSHLRFFDLSQNPQPNR